MSDKLKPLTGPAYDIGYGKPPQAGQFHKGQSGNPKGRPKKNISMADTLNDELKKKKTVLINGKSEKMTQLEIMIAQLVGKAAKGDAKAIRDVLSFGLKSAGENRDTRKSSGKQVAEHQVQSVTDDDLIWISDHLAHLGIGVGNAGQPDNDDDRSDGGESLSENEEG